MRCHYVLTWGAWTHWGSHGDIVWPGGVGRWLRRLTAGWRPAPRWHPPPLTDSQCPTRTRSPNSHPNCTYHIHLSTQTHTLHTYVQFKFYYVVIVAQSSCKGCYLLFWKSILNYSMYQKPPWSSFYDRYIGLYYQLMLAYAQIWICFSYQI